MFLAISVLILTAIGIQVLDMIGGNYESLAGIPPTLMRIAHAVTAVHVVTGFTFAITAIIHIYHIATLKMLFYQNNCRGDNGIRQSPVLIWLNVARRATNSRPYEFLCINRFAGTTFFRLL
jgi:hypothetical protein